MPTVARPTFTALCGFWGSCTWWKGWSKESAAPGPFQNSLDPYRVTGYPEVIRPGRSNEDCPPENLLVKRSSDGEVTLASDAICQPCVCSDTYEESQDSSRL